MSDELPKKAKTTADTAKACERMHNLLDEAQAILNMAGENLARAHADGTSGMEPLSAAIGALRKLMWTGLAEDAPESPAPDTCAELVRRLKSLAEDAPESPAPAESGPAAAAPSAASEQLDKLYPGAMGRMSYWEETVCQLMAMMRYCARGDADIAALKTAIRLVAKKHRDAAKSVLKKRAERGQS